ncbi:MAG: cupin domain-containing protein [Planctomycetes bacterium]|nr:cupin domain-containing protein [Planctomycetota bacterium]
MLAEMFDLDSVPFRETRVPGIAIHFLESDRATGYAAVLIRMEPGSRYPGHRHTGSEELLVLRGAYADESGCHEAGSFVRYEAGTAHRPYCPEDGGSCVFFAIAREGIELFGDSEG